MGATKALLTTGVVYLRSLAAGGGSATFSPGGKLASSTTQAATGANLTETDLWTYTLPAATLNTDGQGIRVTTWGTFGANANTKNIRGYFGATSAVLFTTTANGLAWRLSFVVLRSGAATQVAFGDAAVDLGGANTVVRIATPAETLANAIIVKMTGQNGSAVANDIVFRGALLELLP